jgi:AsmA-like C-terminal region
LTVTLIAVAGNAGSEYGPTATVSRDLFEKCGASRLKWQSIAQEGAMPFFRRRREASPPAGKQRRLSKCVLGALAVPAILWGGLLVLVPTECARSKIVDALSKASGRTVRLSAVRLGVLGGVRLEGLELAEPAQPEDPWLKADRLDLDLSFLQLVSGQFAPREIRVDGLAVRVHRRADGSLEFGDLIPRRRPPPADAAARDDDPDTTEVAFKISGATISILDDPSDTQLEFSGVEGQGTWQPKLVELTSARGRLNDGMIELSALVDRTMPGAGFEGTLRANGVKLGSGIRALSYLAPVLSDAPPSIDGRLRLEIYAKAQCGSSQDVAQSIRGQGRMVVEPITLDGSPFVAELARAARLSSHDQVGSVSSDFDIGGGRVATKNLTLKISRIPVVLVGWTSFDGQVDYHLKTDQLTQKIAKEARGLLDDLPIDLNELATLRVQGDLHHLSWTVANPIGAAQGRPSGERLEDQFRQLGRQLKDRIRR